MRSAVAMFLGVMGLLLAAVFVCNAAEMAIYVGDLVALPSTTVQETTGTQSNCAYILTTQGAVLQCE